MMESSFLSFLSFCGSTVLTYFCLVGAAITLRWGTTGLGYIFRNRHRIDGFVRNDARKNLEGRVS